MKLSIYALGFILVLEGPAYAGDLVGQVWRGRVPASNETVNLKGPNGIASSANTNPSGFYEFHNLPEGEYTLNIGGRSENVRVPKTGETQKDIYL